MSKKEEESDSKEALNVIEKEVKVTSDYYIIIIVYGTKPSTWERWLMYLFRWSLEMGLIS